MQRVQSLHQQATAGRYNTQTLSNPLVRSADDVVIVSAYRSALTKAKKGALKDTPCEVLLSQIIKGSLQRAKVDPKHCEDLVMGNCLMPGAGAFIARAAQLMAGLPVESSAMAINRQCSSGIEACSIIASKIKSGVIDCGIGAGIESMSNFDMQASVDPEKLSEELFDNEVARNCLMPMGNTSEEVAKKYGLKREDMDKFAAESVRKAHAAQQAGYFKDEIIPVKTQIKDKEGNMQDIVADQDDGIRPGTTAEKLGKLRPSFAKDGVSTAGNSSQVSDGCGVVIMARRSYAQKHGLPIVGRFVSYAVAGVPPQIMGVGPAYAIPKALRQVGMEIQDIDIFEINEAFATQAKWSIDTLGIDYKKVNPKGGAIALGHPLGSTGARMVSTLLFELKRTNQKRGVISMCIGTGMGAAAIIESE